MPPAAPAATVNLPPGTAIPVANVSNPGFVVRTAQASTNVVVGNSFSRAIRQLDGTLTDANNNLITNVALPGPEANGAYFKDLVSFEGEGVDVDVVDPADPSTVIGYFWGPEFFPGIPGSEGEITQFAAEVLALVQLPAGQTTLAINVNGERTDVNDDDGYSLFVGSNPRDYFSLKIADFDRSSARAFTSNQHIENQVVVNAPVAGVYPFRIVYWQTGRKANLQFYMVTASGERILLNDPNDTRSPRSFRTTSSTAYNSPYFSQIIPIPGSAGVSASAPIQVVLFDGSGTTINGDTIALTLNGAAVQPSRQKDGNRTTVTFNPDPTRPDPNNIVRLTFQDSNGTTYSNQWAFTIITAGGSATTVAGQWDFDAGDLRATIGNALAYLDPTYDGPTGTAQDKTAFGSCSALGVSLLGGEDAKIMRVPGELSRRIGYVMTHGIAPNGGGTRVNQYTLIMDVYVAETGAGAASLWQCDPNNGTDGDLFWQGSNFGQGTGGYNGRGTFTAGAWHRVIAAYDMAANPPVVTKYVDGIKQDDWTANQSLDNDRRSLLPTAVLFGDGDQDERREMWVNSIQIRSGKLTDAEMFALGGPSASGIPLNIPQSNVAGQWDFDFKDLGASIGKPLAYLDPTYDGPEGTGAELTQFGTCTELGVDLIDGQDAMIMRVPGELSRRIGYLMTHGLAPNGGGTRVNQYTLIMDVWVDTTGSGAASLWQCDPSNGTDGDLFWQGSNFGQGTGGYNGRGTFTAGAWHRVIAAYDMAANPPVVTKYVDGIKQDDWTANQSLDNDRRTLLPTAVLFGDGDQDERRAMWVNSVQIRSGKLSDVQCAILGKPQASGIPVVLPASNVTGHWDFEFKDLGATVGKNLEYLDPTYDGPAGTAPELTQFGTCTELGVDKIGDQDALIMRVPGELSRRIGYLMTHGIAPNGGGTRVNQYTLIMDIWVDTSGPGAASLWQCDPANGTDGDLFWQGGNFGQGTGGYNGLGTFTAGAWHRVAAAYNMAASPPVVTKYVDGIFQDDWTANQSLDNDRRSLLPTAVLFGDGDQDERRAMWVSSIQIRSGALSKAELEALGGPSAGGIPLVLDVVVETPPTLQAARSGNQLQISWPADATGYTLQTSPSLTGASWTAVPGVVNNSVSVPISTTANAFYRLTK